MSHASYCALVLDNCTTRKQEMKDKKWMMLGSLAFIDGAAYWAIQPPAVTPRVVYRTAESIHEHEHRSDYFFDNLPDRIKDVRKWTYANLVELMSNESAAFLSGASRLSNSHVDIFDHILADRVIRRLVSEIEMKEPVDAQHECEVLFERWLPAHRVIYERYLKSLENGSFEPQANVYAKSTPSVVRCF